MSGQNQDGNPSPTGSYPGKGMSIAAMVLGIVALVFSFLPVVGWAGIIIAIVGLVLAVIGKKKAREVNAPTGMATAGLVMSIIALGLAILITIVCLACVGAAGSALNWLS